jgi:CRP-like cAMP-binding protein
VIAAGSRTDRLLILRKGAVTIVKEGIEIAKVAEPGAMFGELSALLNQPHTADVRALETSQFYIGDANALLVEDPIVCRTTPRTFASPLYGDPAGLPPTLIHVGRDEALRDDAARMAERLRAAGCG